MGLISFAKPFLFRAGEYTEFLKGINKSYALPSAHGPIENSISQYTVGIKG